ncbi:cysteine desulfurase family protein [Methylotuvimicrobium sp.]|uniref:cysteine desulfurase family protein n=1 Tax=Methylotuvimicrobium sp. TaxID=2822413 RepID=UPI003D64D8AD
MEISDRLEISLKLYKILFYMDNVKTLYFDYQSTTPVSEDVLLKMLPYFRELFANPHSADHVLGWNSAAAIDNAAQQVACLIGADRDEIIFTSGATESNNQALLGLAKRSVLRGSRRKRILLSAIEHKSVLSIGRVLEDQYGFNVETISVDRYGQILLSDLEQKLSDDVLMVSIMAVNNEIGTIQDIAGLSKVIKAHGAIFHCDAAQSPIAISLKDYTQNVDLLSLSGHKMCGPKGIGALYIRRDLQDEIEPVIYGGGQQHGLRSGTVPTPLCVGMGAASEYMCLENLGNMRDALRIRRDRFIDMLSSLPWPTKLYGPEANKRHPGNMSIGFLGFNAQDILGAMQPHLAASTGSACTSGIPEPSHVLKAIGLKGEEADSVIRFSLGFETTDSDLTRAAKLIWIALSKLSD